MAEIVSTSLPGAPVTIIRGQYFVPISVSSSGDNTIVAGIPRRKIRVIKYSFLCADAVIVTWKSSTAGAITGPESYAANGGIADAYDSGIMQTATGEGLVMNLSGAVSVGGKLTYILV